MLLLLWVVVVVSSSGPRDNGWCKDTLYDAQRTSTNENANESKSGPSAGEEKVGRERLNGFAFASAACCVEPEDIAPVIVAASFSAWYDVGCIYNRQQTQAQSATR
ncbi:hypothetical protein ACLKA7_010482 [Drosophila subpalustris]